MSEPLQVKVSRDGKEIGTYTVQEAVRLLVYGTLKETDFYWHEGMADWAPLTQLQASEARRQLAEKALRDKQEQEAKAAALALEKAKAKEEEERVIAENVRIEMDKRKAGWFRCHCCRESFNEPKDPASDFGPAIAGLIVSGLLAFIPVIGWALGAILAIYCFCIILASQIVAPYCPSCRSSNFSRPEKTGEKK